MERPLQPDGNDARTAVLVNLTGHIVTVLVDGNPPVELPACDQPARVHPVTQPAGQVMVGTTLVPMVERGLDGDVHDLPAPIPGTLFVVSTRVATAARHRRDLVSPGDLVRNTHGTVIGCRTLVRVADPGE